MSKHFYSAKHRGKRFDACYNISEQKV